MIWAWWNSSLLQLMCIDLKCAIVWPSWRLLTISFFCLNKIWQTLHLKLTTPSPPSPEGILLLLPLYSQSMASHWKCHTLAKQTWNRNELYISSFPFSKDQRPREAFVWRIFLWFLERLAILEWNFPNGLKTYSIHAQLWRSQLTTTTSFCAHPSMEWLSSRSDLILFSLNPIYTLIFFLVNCFAGYYFLLAHCYRA